MLCAIGYHENLNDHFPGSITIGGVIPLPRTSTTEALKLLGNTINFIVSWLKFQNQTISGAEERMRKR